MRAARVSIRKAKGMYKVPRNFGVRHPLRLVALPWKEIRFCGLSSKAKCTLKEYIYLFGAF